MGFPVTLNGMHQSWWRSGFSSSRIIGGTEPGNGCERSGEEEKEEEEKERRGSVTIGHGRTQTGGVKSEHGEI